MYPHRIRLRGPWECEPLPSGFPPRRVVMPCRRADVGLAGPVRCRRRFGYPGNLDADERAWLTGVGMIGTVEVSLNDTPLGRSQTGPFEFDVTALLRRRNELVLDIEAATEDGANFGEVALEIRRTAYLRKVAAQPVGDGFEVTGEVVGTAEGFLELYVLLDRRHAAYEVITPLPEGQAFRLSAELPDGSERPTTVQVDLVNGATVWYTLTQPIGEFATKRA